MVGSVETTPSMTTVDVDEAGSVDSVGPAKIVQASETTQAVQPPKVRPPAEEAPSLYAHLSPFDWLAKQQSISNILFTQPHILDLILFYTRPHAHLTWALLHSTDYWNQLDPDPLFGATSSEVLSSFVYISPAFRAACTRTAYHTLELTSLASLHRALAFLRAPIHARLRQHIKVLHIYAINTTSFPEFVKPGSVRDLHKLIPPSEVPVLFPSVHTVNLMEGTRIDPAFLCALPRLRVLRVSQNALLHRGEDTAWPRARMDLRELSILHAKTREGVWPARHRMESHSPTRQGPLYDSDMYLDLGTGWLAAPGVLTSITKLTFNAPRLWGLLDMARIIEVCPVLRDLHCEMHSFCELWDPDIDSMEHPPPWVKLESNSMTNLHVHFHVQGDSEWPLLLLELLGRSRLPRLRRIRLSFLDRLEIDVPTRSIETFISTRGQAALNALAAGLPEHVTAHVDALEIGVAKPGRACVEHSGVLPDAGGLLPRQRVAIERVVRFMRFEGRGSCVSVRVRERREWNGLPTDMQADERESVA